MRKLRRIRAEKGLTMDALEERTGVSKRTISEIERGMRAPQALTLAKIASALGVGIDDLSEEEAPKVEPPLEDDVPPEAPAPKAVTAPLNELLEAAGCETSWLTLSDEEWHEAYSAPTPEEGRQKAIEIGREVQDEYLALRPDLVAGMEAERILYPKTAWWRCPFGSVWIQAARRYGDAYDAARRALEDTDDPTDGGRFPPRQTPGAPEEISEGEPRYVLWAEDEAMELVASAPIP